LCGKFEDAGVAIVRGLEIDSTYLYLSTNLPHTILFQGNLEKARDIYRANADREFVQFDPSFRTLRDAYLDDFKTFRREAKEKPGFLSPQQLKDMDLIEQDLMRLNEKNKRKNR
ncbi:MAG: hypothetical protein H7246_23075, partial [Phycisphaerae bacterium]|nr:hypothetical protein [Saprospiraceae bacterium]